MAEIQEWAQGLEEIRGLIGDEFARSESRNNAVSYIRGLLLDEERKNSWTLSERAGHGTPVGVVRRCWCICPGLKGMGNARS